MKVYTIEVDDYQHPMRYVAAKNFGDAEIVFKNAHPYLCIRSIKELGEVDIQMSEHE